MKKSRRTKRAIRITSGMHGAIKFNGCSEVDGPGVFDVVLRAASIIPWNNSELRDGYIHRRITALSRP